MDLVAPFRRVDRPVRLIRILLDKEFGGELVECKAPDRLARVRRVVLAVVGPLPGHDLYGAQPGASSIRPRSIGSKAEQR